jgi:hypothetical protein
MADRVRIVRVALDAVDARVDQPGPTRSTPHRSLFRYAHSFPAHRRQAQHLCPLPPGEHIRSVARKMPHRHELMVFHENIPSLNNES